jgi:hypothetical protein
MTVMRTWAARALLVALLGVAACAPVSAGDSGLGAEERCARDGGRWRGDFCERGAGGGY